MTTIWKVIIAALVTLAAAVGSFTATRAVRPASPASTTTAPSEPSTEAVFDWLRIPADQRAALRANDPSFADDLRRLRAELAGSRSELAAALDQPTTASADIRAKSEAVIAASAALERRVTDHLLSIHEHLTADQQRQLFGLCAEGVRQGRGWQWRHGQGGGRSAGGGGRGMGFGRGRSGPP
jgi:Spy/CpxP family protein refolding chaperone